MTDVLDAETVTEATLVTQATLDERIIPPADFVADTSAFVDVRLEGSIGKASYSFIGPGVSQNPNQTINLVAPHGFNIGAASMGAGVINNAHLHYTAEVFLCREGSWRFAIGTEGQQTLDVSAGDVFSVPTWVFRGFQNIGDEEGLVFTVLGHDDTGGILWAPDVLRRAAETGMYLTPDAEVIDTTAGQQAAETLAPLGEADLAETETYTDAELAARCVTRSNLDWSEQALLSSAVEGHACAVAPVIGLGMTEARRHQAPITNAHGFTVEWLRVGPDQSTGLHRHGDTQVLFLMDGQWRIECNRGEETVASKPDHGSIVSVPEGAWRNFVNTGPEDAYAVVVNGGDAPTQLVWDEALVASAEEAGFAIDANGSIAPARLLAKRGARARQAKPDLTNQQTQLQGRNSNE